MGIAVRFASSAPSLGHLSSRDFRMGVDFGQGYGPTSTNLFWNSITPGEGEYIIYGDKGQTYGDQGPSIYVMKNYTGLKNFLITHNIFPNISSPQEGIYSASIQDGICIINREPEPFHCDSTFAVYDAGFSPSLASGSLTNAKWFNLGSTGGAFVSGSFGSAASWNSTGSGSVIFPGSGNSYANLEWGLSNRLYDPWGVAIWFYDPGDSTEGTLIGKGEEGAGNNGVDIIKKENGTEQYFKTIIGGETTDFTNRPFVTGSWNYVVFNFLPSSNEISINGGTLGGVSRSSTLSQLTSTRDFYVGSIDGSTQLFDCRVAKIVFREGGWKQAEIDDDWESVRTRFGV